MKSALLSKLKHAKSKGDVSGDDTDSALHDAGIGMKGEKNDDDNEEVDRAPSVSDDPAHMLEGGGDKDHEMDAMQSVTNKGQSAPAPSHALGEEHEMLSKIVKGTPIGRPAMTLGERASGKMQERMAAIKKEKEQKDGDAAPVNKMKY